MIAVVIIPVTSFAIINHHFHNGYVNTYLDIKQRFLGNKKRPIFQEFIFLKIGLMYRNIKFQVFSPVQIRVVLKNTDFGSSGDTIKKFALKVRKPLIYQGFSGFGSLLGEHHGGDTRI